MAIFVPNDRKSLFRQFLAGMYDAVVITDPNGHIIEISPRAEEYFERTGDDVVDQPVSLLVPGLTSEIVQRIRRGLETDHHMMIDAPARNRGGSKFMCEVTVSEIDLLEPGDLVFTIRNVERRRKIHEMLRAKESAFEISPAALFACDASGRFLHVNASFLDTFGFESEDAAKAAAFAETLADETLAENFKRALAGETVTASVVAQVADEGGAGAEMVVTLSPTRIGRKVCGVVGSVSRG